MKILVDFQDTFGGAPQSLKSHAQALACGGHDIIAVVSKEDDEFFKNTDFKIYFLPRFRVKSLFKNLVLIKRYRDIIKKERVNMLFSNRVGQLYFLNVIADITNVPILNARAGGFNIPELVKIQKDRHYIVYSLENLENLVEFGFAQDRVFVLQNRIPVPLLGVQEKEQINKEIIISFIGNIKEDTLEGVLWFIGFLEKNKRSLGKKYLVYFAGENLIKDPDKKKYFNELITSYNKNSDPKLEIKFLGWRNDLTQLQFHSHVCIGKGRSVIQPAMVGKVCYVISEKGELYRCSRENYHSLASTNFTGRSYSLSKGNDNKEFLELLNDHSLFNQLKIDALSLKETFLSDYSIEFAEEKLQTITARVLMEQRDELNFFKGWNRFLNIYWKTLVSRLAPRKN